MPSKEMIQKFAELAVKTGANVQKGQPVIVRSSTETIELAREIAKQAYIAGAKRVEIQWSDDYVSRYGLDYMDLETLKEVPEWVVKRAEHAIESNACFISITSPIPGLNAGVDPIKPQEAGKAMMRKLSFF